MGGITPAHNSGYLIIIVLDIVAMEIIGGEVALYIIFCNHRICLIL